MGQYYLAVNLDKQQFVQAHDYDNGLKLTEHSYIGNKFMLAVETLLRDDWSGDRIVWTGDYAPKGLFGAAENEDLYELAGEKFGRRNPEIMEDAKPAKFIINMTKGEYVDTSKCPKGQWGMITHPLSILTSSGNDRGGGDYRGDWVPQSTMPWVGRWAGDAIQLADELPEFVTKRDYDEIVPNFKERKPHKKKGE